MEGKERKRKKNRQFSRQAFAQKLVRGNRGGEESESSTHTHTSQLSAFSSQRYK